MALRVFSAPKPFLNAYPNFHLERIMPTTVLTTSASYTDLAVSAPRGGGNTKIECAGSKHPSWIRVGDMSAPDCDPIYQYVFAFEIPVLMKDALPTSVTLSLQLQSINQTNVKINHNADLWIVGYKASTSEAASFRIGGSGNVSTGSAGPDGDTLVQAALLTPDSKVGVITTDEAGSQVLKDSVISFLKGLYASSTPYKGGTFLCLRLSCDKEPAHEGGIGTSGYQVLHSVSGNPPTLQLTIS
jgi:hypothetical protein